MNRAQEMENFFEYFKELYKSNPNFPITEDTFYDYLASYGLTDEEKKNNKNLDSDSDIMGMFEKWQKDFENMPNLNVYHSENQRRFLQFRNCGNYENYKLYLSFSKEDMYSAVKNIFEFIAKENLATTSKVADCLRSDSIVLRMLNAEDVIKLLNYINFDSELSKYAKKTNPFTSRIGVVGFAYDKLLSYNFTLCHFLKEYFSLNKEKYSIDDVNLQGFRKYMLNEYYKLIRNDKIEDEYIRYEITCHEARGYRSNETIKNFKHIMNLINMNLAGDIKLSDYLNVVDDFRKEDNPRIFFETACQETLDKYGESQLLVALKNGIDGNYAYFTNNHNCRDNLVRYVSPELFETYANSKLYKLGYEGMQR